MTDTAFANYVKLLVPGPSYKSKMVAPPDNIDANFVLVSKEPFNPDTYTIQFELVNKLKHIYPDVLWFQPYSKNPSALNYALTLGLLIEYDDLDGVVIPIPNIQMSLTGNNSMYLQRTIPTYHSNIQNLSLHSRSYRQQQS